ncbi:MAG TPA: flavin reductase [Steroidobacteraceae bacterium]|jgi:3-hydroxy-9,10-secoandrosta-1,3,5(10)-triene-9,17-dione monooxygenase reductase component
MSDTATDQGRSFRNALGAFATGVTVVTARDAEGSDVGLTANSFNSVSLDPPMVLWSLAKTSRSLPVFMAAEHFAVHILAADQQEISTRFAQRGPDKFAALQVDRGLGDIPLLRECSARFQCRTAFRYEGGDHMIFVGQVETFDHLDRPPLLYHSGRYALAVRTGAPATPLQAFAEPDSSFSQDFLIYLLGRAHHQLFLQLRRELDRHRLSEEGWFVLSLLGVSNHRSVHDLQQLLAYTGKQVTYDLVAGLASAGMVSLSGHYDPQTHVSLTEAGRTIVIELVSAAKAVESHAERNLGSGATQYLKEALRQIIRDSDAGPPAQHWVATPETE